MLIDHFYEIRQLTTNGNHTWTALIELTPGHILYRGHFPEQPVVPGVCTLQIIKECVEHIVKQTLQYTQISSCKFLSALNPQTAGLLEFAFMLDETEENVFRLQAEGTTGEKGFIKLKAQLARK